MEVTKREQYESRLAALRQERATWEPAWRDITEQLVPYRAIWTAQDRGRGDKKESKIINNTPVRALGTLSAGMMAGVTSPARQWFSLTTVDEDLAEVDGVRDYLDQCQKRIAAKLQESNWYSSLANGTYLDLGSIGTSAMFEEEGAPGQVHFRPLPIGEYFLDIDHEGVVDTCFRELSMTVRQLVQKFGRDACSMQVRQAYDKGDYGVAFVVYHAIRPNDEYKQGRIGAPGMRFSSCWWESGSDKSQPFLREGGYEEFPVLAPRWFVRPGDVYGRGPGWEVRGDCRALQHKEKRLLSMLDKTVDPPMRASGNIKRASLLPGDVTHVPRGEQGTYEPAMMINPAAMQALEHHIARDEQRIKEAMYVHLWQSLVDDERNQRPTATEVEAKRQEVMLMLGPLLENLNNGLLEPAVERTFNILDRADMLPMPPEELHGQQIKIKFISIMHQMQQATGLVGLRTLVQETANLGAVRPDALDKLDVDKIVDELGRITGVRPDAILSKDEVDAVRHARAKQEEAKQNGEAMLAATQGIKNVSGADPAQLSDLAGALSPAAAAQAGALAPASAA